MADRVHARTLDNGLAVLVEPIDGLASAAMRLSIPAGAAVDPAGRLGASNVLAECVWRGAGGRDSRTLLGDLDRLGLHRGSGAGVRRTTFAASGLPEAVAAALPIYADVVRRPHLDDDALPPARDLALQALAGVDDDPGHRMGITLSEWFWPSPLGRNPMGDPAHLAKLTPDAIRHHHAATYRPHGSILAVAGNVDADVINAQVEALFGDWTAPPADEHKTFPPPGPRKHVTMDSEQTHIGLAFPIDPPDSPDYYLARLAVEVLGGGSSARLFTELREKRGLCYSVGAGYAHTVTHAGVFASVATTPDRAADGLAALGDELDRWHAGVTDAELHRARTGLLSATIMAGDSTASRCATLADDPHTLGRVRGLDEIGDAIRGVTLDALNDYLNRLGDPRPPRTLITVGPDDPSPDV